MEERPIIFSTELIPKILDGAKTQTRRVIKPQPQKGLKIGCYYGEGYPTEWVLVGEDGDPIDAPIIKCPYGQVGDRLWVRETFAYESPDGDRYVTVTPGETKILYHATGDWEGVRVPSIFMPRWASRITLEITEIRVERLQEITDADAVAEGVIVERGHYSVIARPTDNGGAYASPRDAFFVLWDSLNAKRGYPWESNPFVWVIDFRRV